MKVCDRFDSASEFEVLLDDARTAASNDWEESFVRNVKYRYDRFGTDTFLSDKQLAALEKIAAGASAGKPR